MVPLIVCTFLVLFQVYAASNSSVAAIQDRGITCGTGTLIDAKDCTNAFFRMPQDPGPLTMTSSRVFWTKTVGRCIVSVRLVEGPEDVTSWAFLYISALWYRTTCETLNGGRVGPGTVRTGSNGNIEISVAKGPRAGGGETLDDNGNQTLSNADSLGTS